MKLPELAAPRPVEAIADFFGGVSRWASIVGSRIVVVWVFLLGVLNLLWATEVSLRSPFLIELAHVLPLHVTLSRPLPATLAGTILLFLWLCLSRRKRVAWALVLLMVGGELAARLLAGVFDRRAQLALLFFLLLLAVWRVFSVQSDALKLRRGVRLLIAAYPLSICYAMIGLFFFGREAGQQMAFSALVREAAWMVSRFTEPAWLPGNGMAFTFVQSLYALSAIVMGYTLALMLRPVGLYRPPSAEERQRARRIVEAHGRSSMAYLALLDDKYYYFSPGGSLIAFTVKNRVAVTLGDPIGPPEDVAGTVDDFLRYCAERDWWPAFCLTYEDYLPIYAARGYRALCMGHEAVVDLRSFRLEGRANKTFRKRYYRMLRLGYRVEFHQPPLSDELMAELRQVSQEWLAMTYGEEKRFFLGWFYDDYIRNCTVAAVHAPEGRIIAFANLMPEFQLNESTIDLMRHRQQMPSGTMDFLFVSLFLYAKAQGFDTFNLGLSALSGLGKRPGGFFVERLLNYLYENWSEYYNFKGLNDFKEKFHPKWVPQYLVYPGLLKMPAAWIAMARANSGDFQPWGYFKRRLRPRPTSPMPARQVWLPS